MNWVSKRRNDKENAHAAPTTRPMLGDIRGSDELPCCAGRFR